MKKKRVDTYAEEEILKGKTHQEIYDQVVATSTFKIHDIAEIVRKIPTLEKRKKYGWLNHLILVFLGWAIAERLLVAFGVLPVGRVWAFFQWLSVVVLVFLFYGIYKYKRNIHLALAAWLIFSTFLFTTKQLDNLTVVAFIDIIINTTIAAAAFFLNVKLPGDYRFDQQLQNQFPERREGLITFIKQ